MIRKAVIPAAGLGTRLLPATFAQPKEMLPCGRKPTIHYVVEELSAAGVREVLIITGRAKRPIEDHFDPDTALLERLKHKGREKIFNEMQFHKKLHIQFYFTRQADPTGLADAIGLAETFVGDEPFIIALGDTIIHSESIGQYLKQMIKIHEKHNVDGTILLEEINESDIQKYGIIKGKEIQNQEWEIIDLIEKPKLEEAPSRLAICGRYIFEPSIFSAIKKTQIGIGNERQLTDSIRIMLKGGKKVRGVILDINDIRYDIGNPLSYAKAFIELCLSDPELEPQLKPYLKQLVKEF
ncbi:MAG: UTP--glucose-1-phosphate uridylyltransferase [Candidatus Helarchaeota archaeon]